MDANRSTSESASRRKISSRGRQGLAKVAAVIVFFAVTLFATSGRLDWVMAWVYMGMLVVNTIIVVQLMDPGLVDERAGMVEGAKKWDVPLAIIVGRLGPLACLIVAGLDQRYGWTGQVSQGLQIGGAVVTALGLALGDWAMIANKFFSPLVRIQRERGHVVVSSGPYRFVRHPGYSAGVCTNLAGPMMLSSWWALIPAGVTVIATVIRTVLEDRTLREELDGYEEYAQRVRYCLIPGIW